MLVLLLEAWWCQLWEWHQVLLGLLAEALLLLLLGWAAEVCLVLWADQQQHHLGPPEVCSASLLELLGGWWDLQEA